MPITNLLGILKLNEIARLEKETREFLSSRMSSEKFKKKQLIYAKGDYCDKVFVIKKGLVRGYYPINEIEVTTWVSIENEFFTSISGFFSQSPCKECIEAIEDTYVDYLKFSDMEEAQKRFPDFAYLKEKIMEEYYYSAELRAIIPRIPGAKERLSYFLKQYNPKVIERTPNKILASLLNMRAETLSRMTRNL